MRSTGAGLACLALAMALCAPAHAGPDQRTRIEIEFLLDQVQSSGCTFIRNGSDYDGAAAAAHLRGKYAAALRAGRIASTEDFIRLIASASSLTGREYTIRCGTEAPLATQQWLKRKLTERPARQVE